MAHQPVRRVKCLDLRGETDRELKDLLKEASIGGVLLAGAGGTGLRTFVDTVLGKRDKDPSKGQAFEDRQEEGDQKDLEFPGYYVSIPLLPNYDLTESLVAVIRGTASFGVEVICGCATATANASAKQGLIGRVGRRISHIFSALLRRKQESRNDNDVSVAEIDGSNVASEILEALSEEDRKWASNLLETFRIADLRVDQTLSFASEKSNVKERGGATKLEATAELGFDSPLDLLLGLAGKAGMTGGHSLHRTFRDELARKSQHTLNPYTPTIATRTLDHLFSSLHDLLTDEESDQRDSARTLAVIAIHVEKCRPDVVISLLTALREVTRRHRREFPLLVTADLDFYRTWRDNVRDPKNSLRSIFDRVLLLPPLLPWEMAEALQKDMGKASVTVESFLPASYLSCGIFRLARQLYHDQVRFLFERPSPANVADSRSPRSSSEVPYEDLERAFSNFLQATYTDYPVREEFIGRIHFLYELLYEVDKHWAELGRDGSFDPSLLFSGEAVKRHSERGIGEPVSRLVADFFSLVVPILTKVAQDLTSEDSKALGIRLGDPVAESDVEKVTSKFSLGGE